MKPPQNLRMPNCCANCRFYVNDRTNKKAPDYPDATGHCRRPDGPAFGVYDTPNETEYATVCDLWVKPRS